MDNENDPLITRKQARKTYFGDVHRGNLARWQAAGKLPPLIRISRKVSGWRKSTLELFLAEHRGGL